MATIQNGDGTFIASDDHSKRLYARFKKGELWTNWVRISDPPNVYTKYEGVSLSNVVVYPPDPILSTDPEWESGWVEYSLEDMMQYYEWHYALMHRYRDRTGARLDFYPYSRVGEVEIKFKWNGTLYRVGSLGSWNLGAQYAFEVSANYFLEKLYVRSDGIQEWFERVLHIFVDNINPNNQIRYSYTLQDNLFPIPIASPESPVSFDLSQLEPLIFINKPHRTINMVTGEATTVSSTFGFKIGESGDVITPAFSYYPNLDPDRNNLYSYFRSSGENLQVTYDYNVTTHYRYYYSDIFVHEFVTGE